MKVKFRSLALFLVLGMMMASCQKESFSDDAVFAGQKVETIHVVYSVDGNVFQTVLSGEEAWSDFISQMIALAKEGHDVTFSRNGSLVAATKEVVTFVTTSEEEANHWAHQMEENGFMVNIVYDKKTGKYTCTAVK